MTPEIQTALNEINNHIGVLNDDFTRMSTDMAVLRTNVEWLMKTYWVLLGSSVSALIMLVINFIKKK